MQDMVDGDKRMPAIQGPRVAIVHDWLTGMRGGERCLEVLCELYPDAPIYTLLHIKGAVSPTIERHPIHTSFLQHLPAAESRYRHYLPLFPRAIESLSVSACDLVISSSHCVAKGIRVPPGACHVSYVYTPMRYVWDQYDAYFGPGQASWSTRLAMNVVRGSLQRWDVSTAASVDAFIAISHHVADRIQRHYKRTSEVIYPPVDYAAFDLSRVDEGFYLMVTAFAPYKRVDLAIEAFRRVQRPLKIIGTGQDEARLRRMAGPNVEFLGWQPDDVVRDYYARCTALLFPGEEDFGIVPLEAMACGKPVIAYAKGGALETVIPLDVPVSRTGEIESSGRRTPTGLFFSDPTPESLLAALRVFEQSRACFDPSAIRAHALSFDRAHFKQHIGQAIARNYSRFLASRPSC